MEENRLFGPGLSGVLKLIVRMLDLTDKLSMRSTCKNVKQIVSQFLKYDLVIKEKDSLNMLSLDFVKKHYRFLLEDEIDLDLDIVHSSIIDNPEILISLSKKLKVLCISNPKVFIHFKLIN